MLDALVALWVILVMEAATELHHVREATTCLTEDTRAPVQHALSAIMQILPEMECAVCAPLDTRVLIKVMYPSFALQVHTAERVHPRWIVLLVKAVDFQISMARLHALFVLRVTDALKVHQVSIYSLPVYLSQKVVYTLCE